jgi:hypothetical protein
MNPNISFHQAVRAFGTQSDLARALSLSRQSISDWKALGAIPVARQWELLARYPSKFPKRRSAGRRR